jgi:hypothetical protein
LNWNFWDTIQRRGTHVSIPKIGSRGEENSFGGILGFRADLRRECDWGNFKWGFFGVLLVVPRGVTEEGDHLMFLLCIRGILSAAWVGFCGIF